MQAKRRINNICEQVNLVDNGASGIEFGLFSGGDDGEDRGEFGGDI